MKKIELLLFIVTVMIIFLYNCSQQCEKTTCEESCRRSGYVHGGFCFDGDCHCYDSIPVNSSDSDSDADVDGDVDGDVDSDGDSDGDTDSTITDNTGSENNNNTTGDYGDLCKYCEDHSDCGGENDYCLRNSQTGEVFCGKDCSQETCPDGFVCYDIPTPDGGTVHQCVRENGTCADFPLECNPPCDEGEECRQGRCIAIGDWEDELQHCVDVINSYRERDGVPPLVRDPSIEAYAMEGARYDAENYDTCGPHCHFRTTGGGGVAIAENEIPGWPLAWYGSVNAIIEQGTQDMYNEGPGGGHHDNLVNPNFTRVGCGIYVTPDQKVWIVQDFR